MSATSNGSGVIGTAGQVAKSIVGGFVGTPALLLIVVLNVVAMLTATYFLLRSDENDYRRAIEVAGLLRTCMEYNRVMATGQQERLKMYTESDQAIRNRILEEHQIAEEQAQAEIDRMVKLAKERLRLQEGQEGARYRKLKEPDAMIHRHDGGGPR